MAVPEVAVAGAVTDKWVTVAALATPEPKTTTGTAMSAAPVARSQRPDRDFRASGSCARTSLIESPVRTGWTAGRPAWVVVVLRRAAVPNGCARESMRP